MQAAPLAAALARGGGPTIICTQAGNVNTGSFDPLAEIVPAAKQAGAWVHVDGAFGLWAHVSPSLRPLVAGVAGADSWATDAHKWLNVPYDSGLAFVADPDALRGSMAATAAYLIKGSGEVRDQEDWVPEFSRRARGFPIYAALRALGRRGVTEMIERCCDLARRMAGRLRRAPGVEILNDVVLNQVLVRVPGPVLSVQGRRVVRPPRSPTTSSAASRPTGPAGSRAPPGTAFPRCVSR
jgi:glutamate/tyrosine decarboxylase-like PLP-dependent enzyme